MFSNKEGDNELPDLPPLKPAIRETLPKFKDEEEVEKHELPSFPDSPIKKGFAQTAIKEAVKEEGPNTLEMEEWEPPPKAPTPTLAPPPSKPISPMVPPAPKGPKSVNIFIQISKFHTAKKAIESAKEKLEEIDSLLKKLRETKMREEQELSAWEREIATVRSKVKDITENIFEKMDVCQRS